MFFFRWKSLFATRKGVVKRMASGWLFWDVVVAVAFRGPYGPETGYDPRESIPQPYFLSPCTEDPFWWKNSLTAAHILQACQVGQI